MGGSKLFADSQKDDESWLDGSKLEEVVFDYNNYCYFNPNQNFSRTIDKFTFKDSKTQHFLGGPGLTKNNLSVLMFRTLDFELPSSNLWSNIEF